MRKYFWPVLILLSFASLLAQQPKSTPASDALVAAAKDKIGEQKALDNAMQQAKSSFDQSQKSLTAAHDALQKKLRDQLKADKKYADLIGQLETIEKQASEAGQEASNNFRKIAGPLNAKVADNSAVIQSLIPIVKKENGFPDSATFDEATQTWKIPEVKKETPK
jgi:hypothetical protein